MKKIIFLIPVLFLLTGCGEYTPIKCTMHSNKDVTEYHLDAEYIINRSGDIVKNIGTTEVLTSNDSSMLDYYENMVKNEYNNYNDNYGGYVYNIERNGNKLTAKIVVDYTKMDIDKYLSDNPQYESYFKDGHMTVDGAKAIYELMGATCK